MSRAKATTTKTTVQTQRMADDGESFLYKNE
jgi:hypothetical protein